MTIGFICLVKSILDTIRSPGYVCS